MTKLEKAALDFVKPHPKGGAIPDQIRRQINRASVPRVLGFIAGARWAISECAKVVDSMTKDAFLYERRGPDNRPGTGEDAPYNVYNASMLIARAIRALAQGEE